MWRFRKITISLLLVVCCCLFTSCSLFEIENKNIATNDNISELDVYKSDGQATKFDFQEYTAVFYMSEFCSGCMKELPLLEQLQALELQEVNISILFVDTVPEDKMAKYDLSNIDIFTLNQKYMFHQSMPYYYAIKDNVVIYDTDSISEFIDHILSQVSDMEKLKIDTYNKLMQNADTDAEGLYFVDKETAKKEVDVDENLLWVSNKTTDDFSYQIDDNYGLYQKIFDIDTFPTIIKVEDGKIIKY